MNNIDINTNYHLPSDWKDIDETFQCQEMALASNLKSSPTSPKDRKYLILADTHDISLITREKSLYNLSRCIIGIERSYSISDFLFICYENSVLTVPDIKKGVRTLISKHETLPETCIKNLRDLGVKYP